MAEVLSLKFTCRRLDAGRKLSPKLRVSARERWQEIKSKDCASAWERCQEAVSDGYVSAVVESSWWLCHVDVHDRTRRARFKKFLLKVKFFSTR